MLRYITSFLSLTCLSLFLTSAVFAGDFFVSGSKEAVAGDHLAINASGLLAHEGLGVVLYRPDGTEIKYSQKADDWGKYRGEVYGAHLTKVGNYRLKISRDINPSDFEIWPFEVFPGAVSAFKSSIELVDVTAPADGETASNFRVRLRDTYGNILAGKKIRVYSSRNEDLLEYAPVSDSNGLIVGRVKSKTPGISVLTAIVEETDLFNKPEIVFHLSNTDLSNVGASEDFGLGRFLQAQLFTDTESSAISEFQIVGPQNGYLKAGETYTFTVKAIDIDKNTVPNYFGTVRFASTDTKAQLPTDYTYDQQDQGAHDFSLAFTFNTPGKHTITVLDLADFRITGEATVQVTGEDGRVKKEEGPSLEIVTPVAGTYRSARVSITGKAVGVEEVRLIDGPTVLINDLKVDESGNFVYQTPALANGVHKFQAFDTADTVNSEEVVITIDRLPPRVIAVELDPTPPYEKEQEFELAIRASEPLSRAHCILEDVRYDLSESGDKFVTNMNAPNECGTYIIACTVADRLGNELEEPNAATIEVCLPEREPINIDGTGAGDDNGELEPVDDGNKDDGGIKKPTAPINLTVQSVMEDRVTLTWSPSMDEKGILNYRVEFGVSPTNLNQFNLTPDERTRWYVEGLEPGTEYFFQVLATNLDGINSDPSNMVNAMTDGLYPSGDKLDGTGSNLWVPIFIAFIGGGLLLVMGVRSRRAV